MIMASNILLFISLLFLKIEHGQSRMDPLVNTKVGLIRGLQATDGDYAMFLGIPYAKVDTANPFGKSIPYPEFEEEFEANDKTAACPQILLTTGAIIGSLDCLHLNIYVPNTASSENQMPVLVWIHGGNFETGSGRTYVPNYIVRHDVIFVTVNYRVGPYGFMCLDTPEVPGNQGLKDQLEGLRWIKNNIEAFGGDVNKITLVGQSAGGRSVDLHLLSPQEKLYNNVILQSGTSLVRDTFLDANATVVLLLAEKLGLLTTSVPEALSRLKTTEPHLLIKATVEIDHHFKPCVEKDFDNVEKFITDHPLNSRVPKVEGIRILIGYTNNEQVARYASQTPDFFDDLNIIYERLKTNFNHEEDHLRDMENIVRRFYMGEQRISKDFMWDLIDFDSDFTYSHPTERSMNIYMNHGAEKIFYYVFSYNGSRNYFKDLYNVSIGGASHADDLGYMFDMSIYGDATPEDQMVIDRITLLWTNFAKFGDPTPETSDLLSIKWEPINKDTMYYLNIDSDLSLMKRPFHDRMAFWDLFYKYNWEFQKGHGEK